MKKAFIWLFGWTVGLVAGIATKNRRFTGEKKTVAMNIILYNKTA